MNSSPASWMIAIPAAVREIENKGPEGIPPSGYTRLRVLQVARRRRGLLRPGTTFNQGTNLLEALSMVNVIDKNHYC
jgi:hypothetical protein